MNRQARVYALQAKPISLHPAAKPAIPVIPTPLDPNCNPNPKRQIARRWGRQSAF